VKNYKDIICEEQYENLHKHKATHVFIICPFSRPIFMQNVIDNFTRQKFSNKTLIVIENNKAVNTFKFTPSVVLKANSGPAEAKNIGLNYIRSNFHGSFWTTFDDDDYYDENYLSELVDNSDKSQVIGKLNAFMLDKNNNMNFLDFGDGENTIVKSVWGWSISSWIQDIDFPLISCGEDNAWLDLAKMVGVKLYATSRYNAYYNRSHGKNTWAATDKCVYDSCSSVINYDRFDMSLIRSA
jgi:glycosyltransferase involved in cell wall biosynthesis